MDLADAWHYAYTDFGEGRGRSPQPVLRAVIAVAPPGSFTRFSAIIDTGGPISVVAPEVLHGGAHRWRVVDPEGNEMVIVSGTELAFG